jgi:hypothetical protein
MIVSRNFRKLPGEIMIGLFDMMGNGMRLSQLLWGVQLLVIVGCGSSLSSLDNDGLLFDLAHNTERSKIMEETTAVLGLNNFTIEYSDLNRDRAALQTQWRTTSETVIQDTAIRRISIRDRAILHITPRGRSTVVTNVYLMVNATLEFEVQARTGKEGAWETISPPPHYQQQYRSIVKDIRNRMLKYHYEL